MICSEFSHAKLYPGLKFDKEPIPELSFSLSRTSKVIVYVVLFSHVVTRINGVRGDTAFKRDFNNTPNDLFTFKSFESLFALYSLGLCES